MIYLIDRKYYVRVGKDFVEVELVYKDGDVDLKPTNNKLESNPNLKYEEINFLLEKENLLKNFKKFDTKKQQNKEEFKSFREKSFR